jgi:hypothetical protein
VPVEQQPSKNQFPPTNAHLDQSDVRVVEATVCLQQLRHDLDIPGRIDRNESRLAFRLHLA